jgi:protein subunit release factor A
VPPRFATDLRSLERDTRVEPFTAGGPGGQHRNKSETAVRLHHGPSGLVIAATERRSQAQNRAAAFARLAAALERLNRVPKRRVATRVPPSEKRHRADQKGRRAETKRTRARVRDE